MAIEKTVFSATAGTNRLAEVGAWLTANAGDYFDEITVSNTVKCRKNNKDVIKFGHGSTSANAIYLSNGTEKKLYSVSDFSAEYAVKTSKGIMIKFASAAAGLALPIVITIAKSSDGDLMITFIGATYGSPNYNEYFCYDFDESGSFGSYIQTAVSSDGYAAFRRETYKAAPMTSIAPIPANDVEKYPVGVYQYIFRQYSDVGTITANGKNYYTNAYTLLEE